VRAVDKTIFEFPAGGDFEDNQKPIMAIKVWPLKERNIRNNLIMRL